MEHLKSACHTVRPHHLPIVMAGQVWVILLSAHGIVASFESLYFTIQLDIRDIADHEQRELIRRNREHDKFKPSICTGQFLVIVPKNEPILNTVSCLAFQICVYLSNLVLSLESSIGKTRLLGTVISRLVHIQHQATTHPSPHATVCLTQRTMPSGPTKSTSLSVMYHRC